MIVGAVVEVVVVVVADVFVLAGVGHQHRKAMVHHGRVASSRASPSSAVIRQLSS